MPSPTTTKRIGYLDAARGIAAFMVMIYHYTGWKYPEHLSVKASHLLFNGADAVSFFFVLSGFVLSFPYLYYRKSMDIGKFYINRLFRIYPAFLIALILNVLFSQRNGLIQAPLDTLWNAFGFKGLAFWEEALLFRGRSSYLGLDWTLTVEIVMSFFIPFLIAMVLYQRRLIIWMSVMSLFMTFIMGVFVTPFLLGILIAVYFDDIQSDKFQQTIGYRFRYLFILIGIIFFSLRQIDHLMPLSPSIHYFMEAYQINFYMLSGIGSFILLVYIIRSHKAQRWLEQPLLIFLGKISYGVYLFHWVIVAAIFEYWDAIVLRFPNTTIAFIVMQLVCIILTLAAATANYYWIEIPLIQKGKRITQRMKETLVIGTSNGN